MSKIKGRLLLLIGALFIATLGTLSVFAASVDKIPRSETLYFNGMQWGPPTNFNPLSGNAAWPAAGGQNEIIYESLFLYDMLTGESEPFIGKEYEWVDEYKLKVTLRDDVHWQDGEPVTSEDVVYTFNISNKYPLSYSNIWLYVDSVIAKGPHTVEIKLKKENPNRLVVADQLIGVSMLPKHEWAKIEEECDYDIKKIREYKNENPIGSGPYTLYYYSPEQIILKRYDEYWGKNLFGKLPAPKYLVHPIFKSNDAGNLAFEKAQVDMGQQFVPQIWKMWEKGLPVGTWYKKEPYFVPASTPSIWFNLKKHPFDIPEVRQAIAHAIDYKKIAELAMTKYSPTAKSSLILPFGAEKKYFNEENVKTYGWEYDPKKSIEILEGIGAKKGKDGIYVLTDGTRLGPFKIECPYGWTDWMVSLEIVVQSAKKVGIEINTYFPETPVWSDDRYAGNFDILMDTPAGTPTPSQPWSRFYTVMYSKGVAPIGELTFRNFGRYSNPVVDELLEKIATKTDEVELKKLYGELDKIYMRDIPIIVLEYRPWLFYEYNSTYWGNFPNENNPYSPPQLGIFGAGVKALYEIKPVK
jgi:peptide/nickel transport system substrate-binding protein